MEKRPERPSGLAKLKKWLARIALTLVGLGISGAAAAAAVFLYFDRGLPSVEKLRDYRPPQVTKVYCADGSVCAEFFRERRTNVEISTLPLHVKNAFLAAEDAEFYRHEGLDYLGMARAVLKAALGHRIAGASTITQQACRNLLLSQERSLSRKIREWILTPRMEKALTKEQILNLYLNQINFGRGRYGIEEAALFYFGKHAKDLTLGEASTLAGILPSPSKLNPVTNIVRAKARQRYVLAQMVRHGFAPKAAAEQEMEKPIALANLPPPSAGPYYAEEIRRILVSRYSEETVLAGGLRVDIAMVPKLQALADDAVRDGLELLDRRHGYRGPVGTIDLARYPQLRQQIQERIAESGKRRGEETLIADLSSLVAPKVNPDEAEAPETDSEPSESTEEPSLKDLAIEPLQKGARVGGVVVKVDDAGKFAELDLGSRTARVAFASVGWARPRGVGKWTPAPAKMSDVLHPGEIVHIRIADVVPGPKPLVATLDQIPEVQGALVAIDPQSRRVVAMTGGYNFALSSFNRATQARRQPGSAFKPFLYAAAIASQKYTPVSIVNDAPEAVRDPYTGKVWKPQNFERGGYDGPVTLRQALTKSKNTVSVRLIEALTPQVAIDFARRAGIRSPLPDNLTLALGTGEVGVLELANGYATLQSLGKFAEPQLLIRVTDAKGTILEEHQSAFEETIPPPVAYLITSLMKSVVEEGTAVGVKELSRPTAAKTGTASEFRDAWFSGFTTDLVATAWVGFDNHDPLGNGETGAKAALPLWLQFMRGAEEGLLVRDFEVPPSVVFAQIDPATGLLAGPSRPGRSEPFLEGTAPTAEAPAPGLISPEQLLLEDRRRGL